MWPCVLSRIDVPTIEDEPEPETTPEEKQDVNPTTKSSNTPVEKTVVEDDMKVEEVENETIDETETKENKEEEERTSADEESAPVSEEAPEGTPDTDHVHQPKPEITDKISQGFLSPPHLILVPFLIYNLLSCYFSSYVKCNIFMHIVL